VVEVDVDNRVRESREDNNVRRELLPVDGELKIGDQFQTGPSRADPVVTVAIRSDGSVESVTFVVSSGVAEVDEAIRRIVRSHEHYEAFPPALAREYDVVEIRRTWHFDVAVRLN
jgi:TonB family protein